jgi:Ser/Thr protein kinase RdoA (MazF antagonist)
MTPSELPGELADADFERLAREAAGRFGFSDGAEISAFGALTENPTFRVVEDGVREPVALRIYRPGGRPAEEVGSELAWISAVRRETPVSTPAVVPTVDGESFARLTGDRPEGGDPIFAAAFDLLPGHEVDDEDLGRLMPRIGEITAQLHVHAREWMPPSSFERPRWDVETTLGANPHWGPWQASVPDAEERQQLERLADTVLRRLRAFGYDPSRFGLMHADLRVANLIADGDDVAVIDFDDCGFCWYLYDLGATLTLYEDAPNVDELVASWVEGYRRVAPLSAEDEREIPTFLMLRRLMVSAYVGLRSDTELAEELRRRGYNRASCGLAEKYLSRFG